MFARTSVVLWSVVVVPSLWAGPFDVPIDPNQSALTFELCVVGSCDSDASPVAGTIRIDLDSIDTPASITLYDFDMQLTDDLSLAISWSFLGQLTANARNVAVQYAYPGTPQGPVPIVSTAFAFVNVPTNSAGQLQYTATGIPCAALQNAGYPCSDTRDLSESGTQTADTFAGTVTSLNRVVTLTSSVDITSPLDPNNPSLGSVRAYGTVRGQVYVPPTILRGDLNCDGQVSFADINPFVTRLIDPDEYLAEFPNCPPESADVNGNGSVGFEDINPFVDLLV